MVKAYSLAQLKHMYVTPLQEAWQAVQIIRFCPQMEPVVAAYRKRYPHIAEAVVMSMDERDARFLGDSTLTYGETRWTSFIQVLSQLKLTAQDVFMDLGCGTGFLCMLASCSSGCRAEGHDIISGLIYHAKQIPTQTRH